MSIFNDDRKYSDNEEEYLAWKQEVAWECRGDDYEPDYDLIIDTDEEGEYE